MIHCPECNSEDISFYYHAHISTGYSQNPDGTWYRKFTLPLDDMSHTFACFNCYHEWLGDDPR